MMAVPSALYSPAPCRHCGGAFLSLHCCRVEQPPLGSVQCVRTCICFVLTYGRLAWIYFLCGLMLCSLVSKCLLQAGGIGGVGSLLKGGLKPSDFSCLVSFRQWDSFKMLYSAHPAVAEVTAQGHGHGHTFCSTFPA